MSQAVAKQSQGIPPLTSSIPRFRGEETQHVFLDKMLSVLRVFNDLSLLALNGNNILVNQKG